VCSAPVLTRSPIRGSKSDHPAFPQANALPRSTQGELRPSAPDIVFAYDRVSRIGSGDEPNRFELSFGRGLDLTADGTLIFRAFVLVGRHGLGGAVYSWQSDALKAPVGSVESERMLEKGVAVLAEKVQEGLAVFVAELPEGPR
jgi:hypothetical protein